MGIRRLLLRARSFFMHSWVPRGPPPPQINSKPKDCRTRSLYFMYDTHLTPYTADPVGKNKAEKYFISVNFLIRPHCLTIDGHYAFLSICACTFSLTPPSQSSQQTDKDQVCRPGLPPAGSSLRTPTNPSFAKASGSTQCHLNNPSVANPILSANLFDPALLK